MGPRDRDALPDDDEDEGADGLDDIVFDLTRGIGLLNPPLLESPLPVSLRCPFEDDAPRTWRGRETSLPIVEARSRLCASCDRNVRIDSSLADARLGPGRDRAPLSDSTGGSRLLDWTGDACALEDV